MSVLTALIFFTFNRYLYSMAPHPIGIFDSGYGGLTVFRSIAALLPQYDYLYLGDNARAPYGNRSFSKPWHSGGRHFSLLTHRVEG